MDENNEKLSTHEEAAGIPESPKPLAFTIDFGEGKAIDTQRHKSLVEKYQKKHRRGQSLSKLEDSTPSAQSRKHPLTGNLPRKSSFQSEGYFSSDEKSDRGKNGSSPSATSKTRSDLTLPLKNVTTEKMSQSCNLPVISSPEVELKDVSSPELDLVSPFSPQEQLPTNVNVNRGKITRQYSSPECETQKFSNDINEGFIDGTEFDFDKSDTVSDAGTYTLETENYSEEQKVRMSIDKEFKIEEVSVLTKTQEYIQSLNNLKTKPTRSLSAGTRRPKTQPDVEGKLKTLKINSRSQESHPKSPITPNSLTSTNQNMFAFKKPQVVNAKVSVVSKHTDCVQSYEQKSKMLSPILSPTQNISITQSPDDQKQMNNDMDDLHNKTFTKIMFPSPKAKTGIGLEQVLDQGSVISVTSSGAFRSKPEKERGHARQLSLTKSEVHVEAYTGDRHAQAGVVRATVPATRQINLSTNIVNVQSIPTKTNGENGLANAFCESELVYANLVLGKVSNLPPCVGGISGKTSPSKIPSPVHNLSRPRSRNSVSSLNIDLSDSSLETESYLKPTQNYIKTLERRLPLESDADSDYDNKYSVPLNNDTRNLLKQKPTHVRHNSFDDRNLKVFNKLEHFQNKNLQGIDQTAKVLNQYTQNKVMHKIQNSPNNSPIRRSSSFSTKNQINSKNTNVNHKESNITKSPNFTRNGSIQRSASTANIKPKVYQFRRSSINSEQKIERNQFGDTESSSEEDYQCMKKDLANITNTKCNRAFTLRRARLDAEPTTLKCPNTPEMKRKFQTELSRPERAISVDRKPAKTTEVQSRYLLNLSRKVVTPQKPETVKNVPKSANKNTSKPQTLARTDSGRFSMRTKAPATNTPKSAKKDGEYIFLILFLYKMKFKSEFQFWHHLFLNQSVCDGYFRYF